MSAKTIIVSDVHLGSDYCLLSEFMEFIQGLPENVHLVLNGDIVDRWHHDLPHAHKAGLEALREASRERRVVWVRGNHDDGYNMPNPESVEFSDSFRIGNRLFASHGYDFDNVLPYHGTFIRFFRTMHRLRMRLGAEPVHVAQYAKKFGPLYNVLCKHVALNAVEYAKENGYKTVVCGHTHYVEEMKLDGVHYINTGSWTEKPVVGLEVTDNTMALRTLVE